jgi:hypothetical protein
MITDKSPIAVEVYSTKGPELFFRFDEEDVVPPEFNYMLTAKDVLSAMMVATALILIENDMLMDDEGSKEKVFKSLRNAGKIGTHVNAYFLAQALKDGLLLRGINAGGVK